MTMMTITTMRTIVTLPDDDDDDDNNDDDDDGDHLCALYLVPGDSVRVVLHPGVSGPSRPLPQRRPRR